MVGMTRDAQRDEKAGGEAAMRHDVARSSDGLHRMDGGKKGHSAFLQTWKAAIVLKNNYRRVPTYRQKRPESWKMEKREKKFHS